MFVATGPSRLTQGYTLRTSTFMVVVSTSADLDNYLEGYDHLTSAFEIGWTVGGIGADGHWCQRLAVEANAVVFDVGYRLAPEHKFPTAIEDSWKALMHVSLSSRTVVEERHILRDADGNIAP